LSYGAADDASDPGHAANQAGWAAALAAMQHQTAASAPIPFPGGAHTAPDLRGAVQHGWRRQAAVAGIACSSLTATLALHPENRLVVDELAARALAVATPSSSKYGHHLSTAQLRDMTAPPAAARAEIASWIDSVISDSTVAVIPDAASSGFVTIEGDVAGLFATQAFEYTLARTGQRACVLGDLVMPREIAALINTVIGVHELPLPADRVLGRGVVTSSRSKSHPPSNTTKVTPALIRKLYSVDTSTLGKGSLANRGAVVEFGTQRVDAKDLTQFWTAFAPIIAADPATYGTVYNTSGDAPLVPSPTGGNEAMLDIEYLMGVAPGIKSEVYEYTEKGVCTGMLLWTSAMLALEQPPSVVSVSYGWQEDVTAFGCPATQRDLLSLNHMKLGLAGTTVVHSSGDSGSGYPSSQHMMTCPFGNWSSNENVYIGALWKVFNISGGGPDDAAARPPPKPFVVPSAECCRHCTNAPRACAGFTAVDYNSSAHPGVTSCRLYASINGTVPAPAGSSVTSARMSNSGITMYPAYPATDAYVTAVGGTEFIDDDATQGEQVVTEFGSGGGFAVYPSAGGAAAFAHQRSSVEAYLAALPASETPPAWLYNRSARVTPDVAALGFGFQVIVDGATKSIGGTSASAPTFAALVTLLNDARIANGHPTMGWINPFLYSAAATGAFTDIVRGNNRIGRGAVVLGAGWNASKGFDPTTGIGTPLFDKLKAAALAVMEN
tara:strand:- start:994 stop:3165 length:2172 start_codon:yes stop_codon:yes gene_type:complete